MRAEDEFEDRDPQGLQKIKKDGPRDEEEMVAAAQSNYMSMLFVKVPFVGQALAWAVYFAHAYLFGQLGSLNVKFEFLHTYDLGYVFLSVWIISIARTRLIVNANAMRAGARLDRPDQHIYKIMDPSAKKDAPYVLMANTGAAGRFNRAQRGVYNTDEGMPLLLVNAVLAGSVFGPVVAILAAMVAYGRITFALGYTDHPKSRFQGFLCSVVGEGLTSALVLLIAVKALAGSRIPF